MYYSSRKRKMNHRPKSERNIVNTIKLEDNIEYFHVFGVANSLIRTQTALIIKEQIHLYFIKIVILFTVKTALRKSTYILINRFCILNIYIYTLLIKKMLLKLQ